MSTFAKSHVSSLLSISQSQTTRFFTRLGPRATSEVPRQDNDLLTLFHQFKDPFDKPSLHDTFEKLFMYKRDPDIQSIGEYDAIIINALEKKIIIGFYAQLLDQWLEEAIEADSDAELWESIYRSSSSVAWYLLATLPQRFYRVWSTILSTLRENKLPIRPSSFSPSNFRRLFPTSKSPQYSNLSIAFFPHLKYNSTPIFTSPIALTRRECELHYKGMRESRDRRAETLGQLLSIKAELESALKKNNFRDTNNTAELAKMLSIGAVGHATSYSFSNKLDDATYILHDLKHIHLRSHANELSYLFSERPPRLLFIWPRLVVIPAIAVILFRHVYDSRESIWDSVLSAHDTVKAFWFGYIVEPVRGILDTVRAGGDEGSRLVNPEAVRADLESLERMALDLTREKLSLNDSQLRELTSQIRQGDLTPVLQIYEQDIKTPVRTAVTGSLIRSLLIQIQKAKVDLDQALSGIDKLLRSQELTFAFVGVAPAFAIVYAFMNGTRALLFGSRGKKRFGGRAERESVWLAIRQVEHLIITTPEVREPPPKGSGDILELEFRGTEGVPLPHLTSGLMLLALTRLRSYAVNHLPPRSLIRAGMLSDISDLENPNLNRYEKLHILERMWRSWGQILGWDRAGEL